VKKIFKTEWELIPVGDVHLVRGSNLNDLKIGLGTDRHGDVLGRDIYNPRHARLFNSFEQAQIMRFLVGITWAREHFQELEKKEGKKRRKVVTDLGCSRSFWYQYWKFQANYFGWPLLLYQGVDINFDRIDQGRKMFIKKKNDILEYFLVDLSSRFTLPKKADFLVCMEVLEHVEKTKVHTLLNSIHKNLKRSGIAIISSPNPLNEGGWVWKDSGKSHHYEYTFAQAKSLLEENGFEIINHTGVLPDRNYFKTSKFPKIRKKLATFLPAPMVNNILVMLESDVSKRRQWIIKAKKK